MALKYWVAKNSTWTGSTGNGTEDSPYLGALAVRNALGTGIVANDVVIFMGEYGPVNFTELTTDWPCGTTYQTATTAITVATTFPAPSDTVNFRGGILFGSANGTTSNASNVEFQFRGDIPFHIDARGASTSSHRMMAAICVQGYKTKVTGLRVAAPNWDYTITANRVASTLADSSYPQRRSHENIGLMIWGGNGSVVNDCSCWGSDAYSPYACYFGFSNTTGQTASGQDLTTEVKNSTFYGAAVGLEFVGSGQLAPAAGAVPDRLWFGPRSHIKIYDNVLYGAYWGNGTINQALYTGNPLSVQALAAIGSTISIYRNEIYGFCQDGMQVISVNCDVYENYVHDLNPGKTNADTFTHWVWDGVGGWTTTTNAYIGDGIKLGLTGYDGSITGAVWNTLGVGDGNGKSFEVDALRNACYRNIVTNCTGYGITTNGSAGMQIIANEVTNCYRGLQIGAIDTGLQNQIWVANNYLEGSNHGIQLGSRNTIWAYNNIFKGAVADISSSTGTSTVIYGDNNIIHNSTTSLGAATNNLTNTISANAAYTEGVGPTVGGNCDGKGVPVGLLGLRAPTRTYRDVNRTIFDLSNLPIGPRQT